MAKQLLRSRQFAFIQQGGKCYYCGLPMLVNGQSGPSQLRCTAEHLLARSKGGTDAPSNIVAACAYCNHSRHKRKHPPAPEHYRAEIQRRIHKRKWQTDHVLKWAEQVAAAPGAGSVLRTCEPEHFLG